MTKEFIKKAKLILAKKYHLKEDDFYTVWYCKTLKNEKALISTDSLKGIYIEVTKNGDKQEFYIDIYKKQENIKESL